MSAACPSVEQLERLMANQLDPAGEAALEEHLISCEACRRRLDELTQFAGERPSQRVVERGEAEAALLPRLANSSALMSVLVEQGESADSTWRRLGGSKSLTASGRFLRRQVWCWPLIAAVLIGVAAWWVNSSVETVMRQQRIDELTTVLDADVAALRQWMDNQRATAELVAADESLRHLVQELLPLSDETPEARSRLVRASQQAAIRDRLTEPLRRGKYIGFIVICPRGVALAVDDDAPVGVALSGYRQDFFARVMTGRSAVSKPLLNPLLQADSQGELRAGLPCMYAAAPICDAAGRPIAALGLAIRPEGQFTEILHVARPGNTGETYAFDRNGLLLSQSRFDDQLKQVGLLVDQPESKSILTIELRDPGVNMMEGKRPDIRRSDQRLTRMANAAVRSGDGCDADGYRDYRGVPVVGAWQWLKDEDFGIATEIDVAEAFAPVYLLRRAFAVLMVLLSVAAGAILLGMLIMARQQRRLNAMTSAAQTFGQYTLLDKLGKGGMGTVYKARHALLRRPTAIKLLNPEKISETTIARFEREVQLTSGLTHPNTVAIYDYGRTDQGVFYYAMEYLEGVNLDDLVNRHGPLPQERVVYILRQVCASLSEAHAAGLVHRDIKPANIFLTIRGGQHDFVKVLDFGLAKLVYDGGEANLTAVNTIAGTPHYVAPEAITHPDRVDARCDVYAIGALGYFLLTGLPVFAGETAADICLMHVAAMPQPPSLRTGKSVNPELEALIMRCLAKSPLDRPEDGADLLRRLDECPLPKSWTTADATRWWATRDRGSAATMVSML